MAKVVGGLFSVEASGKFANALVFDRRGYVRGYTRPTNPQTEAQGNVRQVMLAAQRAIGLAGDATKAEIKEAAPDYRWNSYLIQQMIGKGSVAWDASLAAFNALDPADQGVWTSEAEALGMTEISIPYAGDSPISAGTAFFALARTLFDLGVYVVNGAPDGANAVAWATSVAD